MLKAYKENFQEVIYLRMVTLIYDHIETAGIVTKEGIAPVEAINSAFSANFSSDIFSILDKGEFEELKVWFDKTKDLIVQKIGRSLVPFNKHNMDLFIGYQERYLASDLTM